MHVQFNEAVLLTATALFRGVVRTGTAGFEFTSNDQTGLLVVIPFASWVSTLQ